MKLVIIVGSGAVGKMTVGQELMKKTGLRLFHNHMMIEPVIEIFGKYDSGVVEKLRRRLDNSELSPQEAAENTLDCEKPMYGKEKYELHNHIYRKTF